MPRHWSPAIRRYLRRLAVLMAFYMVAIFLAGYLFRHHPPHGVAAYALAGVLAAVGGILLAWYNGLMTPGSVGTSWLINILVVAVLGGMRHPIGAFIGGLIFSGGTINNAGLTLTSFLVSLVGAVILLAIVNLVRRGSVR